MIEIKKKFYESNSLIKFIMIVIFIVLISLAIHMLKILAMKIFPPNNTHYITYEDTLQITPFADGENWYLQKDFQILIASNTPSGEHKYRTITVPKGFVTDFASVPGIVRPILPKWDLYGQAAIVHDFLYWDRQCTQEQADQLLNYSMRGSNVGVFVAETIYRGLRLFGWYGYKENRINRIENKQNRIICFNQQPFDPKKNSNFEPKPGETYKQYADRTKEKNPPQAYPTHTPNVRIYECSALDDISVIHKDGEGFKLQEAKTCS